MADVDVSLMNCVPKGTRGNDDDVIGTFPFTQLKTAVSDIHEIADILILGSGEKSLKLSKNIVNVTEAI